MEALGTAIGIGRNDGDSGGEPEISDSNYSDQPLENVIGLSYSPETFAHNETNESTFGFPVNDDLFPQYPAQLTQFVSVVCVIFFLFGIPGNLLTIIALAKCKKVM